MANATDSAWSDTRVEMLKAMWNEGRSAGQIAGALPGGFTRNAVIGKLTRLGLQRSPGAVSATRSLHGSRGARVQKAARRIVQPPPPVVRAEPAPAAEPISILALKYGVCRWPLREADVIGGYLFCGCKALEGRPYCGAHAERARDKNAKPINTKSIERLIRARG